MTIRPMAFGDPLSVNHNAPSAPARTESPSFRPVGLTPLVISVIWPAGVISATADGVIGFIEACGTHRLPSAPAVMSSGRSSLRPVVNSVIWPDGVTRPIARRLPYWSVNQTFPSGPGAIASGSAPLCRPLVNSWTEPLVVIRPIAELLSANHRFPSGPTVMFVGSAPIIVSGYSVTVPSGAIAPIDVVPMSENQILPSGPTTMLSAISPVGCNVCRLLKVPPGVILTIALGMPGL